MARAHQTNDVTLEDCHLPARKCLCVHARWPSKGCVLMYRSLSQCTQDYFTYNDYSVGKSDSPRDVIREIPYGPLNTVLRCDIFPTFRAISMHLAAFHKTKRTKFSYEALFAYVLCISTLGARPEAPVSFSNIVLY